MYDLSERFVASLTQKTINGKKYFYARVCKRVNGKPKIIHTVYLGTIDKMIKSAKQEQTPVPAKEVLIAEMGATAALWGAAKRLGLVELIDRYATKRKQGPSVGQYMLIAAINRAVNPTSKTALGEWFENTAGPRLLGVQPNQLSSQAFWNHMGKLGQKDLIHIENDILDKLVNEFKIDLKCLLYDGTNFHTYINTKTKSELAKRGHNKQKRNDLRQVSLGLMTSADFNIPLLHQVYGGNVTDPPQFASVVEELVSRYKQLTEACPSITLVFDKGNNSEGNFEAFENTDFHFVGSLKLNQCPKLVAVPLKKYRSFKDEDFESVKAYRCRQRVFNGDRTVLITFNENLLAGQFQGIGRNITKCKSQLHDLQIKLKRRANGHIKKGKKPTPDAVKKQIDKILQREYMKKIIKTTVTSVGKTVKVQYHVDQNTIDQLSRTVLGKTILFTDNHTWTDEQIIRAYRSQYKIEHAFRDMKNPHCLGWDPRFHWTDQKIRVHAFYCVMALTLVNLIKRELAVKGMSMSTERLIKNLSQIRETTSVHLTGKNKTPKLTHAMSRLTPTQKKLFDLLNLERFKQN